MTRPQLSDFDTLAGPMNIRAKFKVTTVERHETCDVVKMSAVCPDKFGPDGESEDNNFARFTPTADLSMNITNPKIIGKIQPGTKYYLDFTPVEEAAPQ